MLTLSQSREYNRFKKLKEYFDVNSSVIEEYPPFANEVTSFNGNFEILEELMPGKNSTGKGITASKTTLKRSVADKLAVICTTTKAYAVKFNNGALAQQMNFRSNDIFKLKDADLLAFVLHVQELITPLLENADYIPYGVTADVLTAIVQDAQSFNGLIGQANVEASGSAVANKKINGVIKKLQSNIAQFDLLIGFFTGRNDGFVEGYRINSSVDNSHVRRSGIEGYVTNNGIPVAGAVVKITKSRKTVVTDTNGYYSLVKVMPGNYSVEIVANGHGGKTVAYRVARGKISKLDIELQAA
jgi:hypothetical protein